MPLQIDCSVEENVTIRTTKRLEDSIYVAYITHVVVVSVLFE